MIETSRTDKAQARVDAARDRLLGTAQEIQARLAPERLLDDAVSAARARSAELAHGAGEAVRKRPVTVAAAIVASMALFAHKPLLQLGRKFFGRSEATDSDIAG